PFHGDIFTSLLPACSAPTGHLRHERIRSSEAPSLLRVHRSAQDWMLSVALYRSHAKCFTPGSRSDISKYSIACSTTSCSLAPRALLSNVSSCRDWLSSTGKTPAVASAR